MVRSYEPIRQHEKQMAVARAWIDAAPTPEERQRRKREMYVALYSCPLSWDAYFRQVEMVVNEANILVKEYRRTYKTPTDWKTRATVKLAELELKTAASLPARLYVDGKLVTRNES